MRFVASFCQRVPYASWILLALLMGLIAISREWQTAYFEPSLRFNLRVTTGTCLLICLCFQWVLLVGRVTRKNVNTRKVLITHRWVGVATTYLFALHAVRFGYVWMTSLSAVLFLVALTGVLNRDVLRFRKNWIYLLWLACHIGLSAALMPLVAVHIWVALAYQ